jgi:hypothetical protein
VMVPVKVPSFVCANTNTVESSNNKSDSFFMTVLPLAGVGSLFIADTERLCWESDAALHRG